MLLTFYPLWFDRLSVSHRAFLSSGQHRGSTKWEAIKGVLTGLWCAQEIDGVSELALAGTVWEGQTGTLIPAMVWGSQRGGSEQQKATETCPASQRTPKPEETSDSISSSSLLFLLDCIPWCYLRFAAAPSRDSHTLGFCPLTSVCAGRDPMHHGSHGNNESSGSCKWFEHLLLGWELRAGLFNSTGILCLGTLLAAPEFSVHLRLDQTINFPPSLLLVKILQCRQGSRSQKAFTAAACQGFAVPRRVERCGVWGLTTVCCVCVYVGEWASSTSPCCEPHRLAFTQGASGGRWTSSSPTGRSLMEKVWGPFGHTRPHSW